MVDKQRNYR